MIIETLLPYGHLVTRQYLLQHGLRVYEVDNALKQKKIIALARGVYARPGVPVDWQGLASSLNRVINKSVYVGGMYALAQRGLAHDLNFQPTVNFYSNHSEPAWFQKLQLDIQRSWNLTTRIWIMRELLTANSLQYMEVPGGSWLLASAEQAYLELLTLVPNAVSFEQADNIMQGLTSLSPKRLNVLLQACRHVLAKRLFFFFAERHQYPWYKRLNHNDYNLGVGKRSVVKNGRLNKKYQITVPQAYHG